MISRQSTQQILDTLPIGYYIGRNVDVTLTDKDTSYYDPMHDKVFISYPSIEKISTDDMLEKDIRCILYHEISHAFLTPQSMSVDNIINVFEDERIESILRHYYKDVDFRSFVIKMNNFKYDAPRNSFEMFYQIVRFRIGPQPFINEVNAIINRYKDLDRNSSYTYHYRSDVNALYNSIDTYFNHTQNDNTQDNLSSLQDNNMSHHSYNSHNTNVDDVNSTNANSSNDNISMFSNEEIKEKLTYLATEYDSEEMTLDIDKILACTKITSHNNGSAINAYSGVFNPRSVIRDDYKYFIQQNRSGHVKAFSKMHLNLFIDCSGSFHRNDITVNKMLKSLLRFEKQNKDFSFDLISCGEGQRLRDRSDRIQYSGDGTYLSETIYETYRKMQFRDANNINIVLYDGDAFAANWGKTSNTEMKRFEAFDNKNTILIIDSENERYTKKYCKNAKVIVTDHYVAELYKHLIAALNILTKS